MVDTFAGGFLMPHPPVIVPAVGRGREKEALSTLTAMKSLSEIVNDLKPETIVIISPHAPVVDNKVTFCEPGDSNLQLSGSLAQFGYSKAHFWQWDSSLQKGLIEALKAQDVPIETSLSDYLYLRHGEHNLDHGSLVPLHFLSSNYKDFKLIVLCCSGAAISEVKKLGQAIRAVSNAMGRKVLLIASGDLSHHVNSSSPYGAVPEGSQFDRKITEYLSKGDFKSIYSMDERLRTKAGECGYNSIVALCSAVEGTEFTAKLYSYEAPFGIGYGVASFIAAAKPDESLQKEKHVDHKTTLTYESDHLRIARAAVEAYVRRGHRIKLLEINPSAVLLNSRGGVFVSIHKHGELRGCIGTVQATTDSLAEEIIQNAISAATGDPRFPPVESLELSHLVFKVDVLGHAEPVTSREELDARLYGVIVEKGMRRGLLLPDLEGVDSVRQQIEIACRKGGIDPDSDFKISKFKVTRYDS